MNSSARPARAARFTAATAFILRLVGAPAWKAPARALASAYMEPVCACFTAGHEHALKENGFEVLYRMAAASIHSNSPAGLMGAGRAVVLFMSVEMFL